MPIYEFECKECEQVLEVIRPMAESSEPHTCPDCGNETTRKFGVGAVIWNCEGSHIGDYGKGNTVGTKADALNKAWSKHYKRKPPAPATDVR